MKNKKGLYIIAYLLIAIAVVVVFVYFLNYEKPKEKNISDKKNSSPNDNQNKVENHCGNPAVEMTDLSGFRDVSHHESYRKAIYVKERIESGRYKEFYTNGKRTGKESLLESFFDMTCECRKSDFNFQVDNGRGPADATVSYGSLNKTTIEFKLGYQSKKRIEQSIKKQIPIYSRSSFSKSTLLVLAYFTEAEEKNILELLDKYSIPANSKEIVLIDARRDNKPAGSKA